MCGCSSVTTKSSPQPRYFRTSSGEELNMGEGCLYMYEELHQLELKVIELLKDHSDPILTDFNKKLRVWVRNLEVACPNEEELNIVRDYVENEYTEYFA